jgi:hypothetical protein
VREILECHAIHRQSAFTIRYSLQFRPYYIKRPSRRFSATSLKIPHPSGCSSLIQIYRGLRSRRTASRVSAGSSATLHSIPQKTRPKRCVFRCDFLGPPTIGRPARGCAAPSAVSASANVAIAQRPRRSPAADIAPMYHGTRSRKGTGPLRYDSSTSSQRRQSASAWAASTASTAPEDNARGAPGARHYAVFPLVNRVSATRTPGRICLPGASSHHCN